MDRQDPKRIGWRSPLRIGNAHFEAALAANRRKYQLDGKASGRGSSVMRHPISDDKGIIKRGMDGHYIYFSVRDDRDNGTIIDFVQYRQRVSLGAVRKELRPWIGMPPVPVPAFPALAKTEKDRLRVEAVYARMQDALTGHPYLEHERALSLSSA